jgi:endonuclease/exonuclease/phosphatase family metal-dependent hydrolase
LANKYESYCIVVIALITYFLIESFLNMILYINAYIFLNVLDDLTFDDPWLIPYVSILILVPILFSLKFIKDQYKITILSFIIVISRALAQYFLYPQLFLLFQIILFSATLLFMVELIILYRNADFQNDYQIFLGGFLIGIGTHLGLLLLNMSSTLAYDYIKWPFTIAFSAILLYLTFLLFDSKELARVLSNAEKKEQTSNLRSIGLAQFFLLGIIFYFFMSWVFNPTRLASYDILDMSYNGLTPYLMLNWSSYGFFYYVLIILIASLISFFVIKILLERIDQKLQKIILISSNGTFCALNCLAILILEQDLTILSTIYLTVLSVSGVFSLLFYISYLFHYYSFPSRLKTYLGYWIFLLAFGSMAALEIIITSYFYTSLLLAILVISLLYIGIFTATELMRYKESITIERRLINLDKLLGILFSIVLTFNLVSFGLLSYSRQIEPEPEGNPTFMVWNIHNAVGVDDIFSLDRIVWEIKSENPDIVGLNEVDLGAMKTSFIDLVAYIANKLNMYYFYGPTFYKHYGNAIFSKYPFLEAEYYAIAGVIEGAEPRAVIRAKFLINSENWTVYVNHLNTKQQDRLAQVSYDYPNSVVSIIERYDFEKVVWMGDFNFRPDSEEYSTLNASDEIKFIDTHQLLKSTPDLTGGFVNESIPQSRIDYIFCSPDLTPNETEVWCSLSSDHCAVITRF